MARDLVGATDNEERSSVLKGVHYSLFDQALLSVSNFLIGLVFIRFASKHDYYAYSQLIGYIALTTAVQAALVNTTALSLLPQKRGADRVKMANAYFGLQLALSVLMGVLGACVIWFIPGALAMDSIGWELAGAMGVMVVSVWLREFLRNIQFIRLRPDLCLWQDLVYVIALIAGIGILVWVHHVHAWAMLYLIAAVGGLSALPWVKAAGLVPDGAPTSWLSLLKEVWPYAKWSLPAGMVAWAFGNGYLLIGANVIGPEGTAEIVAAKLFTAPLGMVFVSWANVFRPKVSQSLAAGDVRGVSRLTNISMVGVLGIVTIYVLMLVLVYPVLESYVLGDKYHGLTSDIGWWGVFFFASGLSGVCNGVLLAGGRFRQSFYAAALSSIISIPMMYVMGTCFSKNGLMLGAVLGEATYAFVLFLGMRRLLRFVESSSLIKKEGFSI
jgi:O-antigen/teichoic acid export membrane protein